MRGCCVAPLTELAARRLASSRNIHVLRDPTRGGLATTLNEIAEQSGKSIVIHETAIPVRPPVAAACELLGFDPLYIANEGKLRAIVAPADAAGVLAAIKAGSGGEFAAVIGEVSKPQSSRPRVVKQTAIGSHRVPDMMSGELLPR